MTVVLEQRSERLPFATVCCVLGLNRSSVYTRGKRAANEQPAKRSRDLSIQPRALSEQERSQAINTLQSDEYCDQPPIQIYHRLLEQQRYLCSVSTMHQLLRSAKHNGERRDQHPAQHHAVPRLLATALTR